jgi:hypothetical protein
MSEINRMPPGHNLTDDDQARCWACWGIAKARFFNSPRRRGRTLNTVYAEVLGDLHQ